MLSNQRENPGGIFSTKTLVRIKDATHWSLLTAIAKANAVSRIDNLEFLQDVIPRTVTYKQYKEKKAKTARVTESLPNGQTTIDSTRSLPTRPADTLDGHEGAADNRSVSPDETIAEEQHDESRNTNGTLIFEHYEPNGTSRRDEGGDVEMG